MTPVDPETWRAYLLGRLAPQEAQGLEDRYFADQAAFDEVLLAEDDLIDEYLDGQLAEAERRTFEERVRERPELAVRLEGRRRLTRALRRRVAVSGVPRLGLRQKVLGVAAAAAAVFVSVRAFQERPVAPHRGAPRPAVAAGTAAPGMSAPAPAPIVVMLGAGGVRDRSTVPTVALTAAAETVRLALPMPSPTAEAPLTAVVEDVEGHAAWSGSARAAGGQVEADVPAVALPPGDYIVRFKGLPGGAEEAFFRVSR